jgi:PIN domain nuclease of toxin-antitoxin system
VALHIKMILLDTCALLWLTDDPAQLSAAAQAELRNPAVAVYASAVSALELGIKVAKGKLGLPKTVSQWFPEACARYGLTELPVTAAIAAASTELPAIHGDPSDRVLIATAQQHSLTLLTPDPVIAKYPNLKVLW